MKCVLFKRNVRDILLKFINPKHFKLFYYFIFLNIFIFIISDFFYIQKKKKKCVRLSETVAPFSSNIIIEYQWYPQQSTHTHPAYVNVLFFIFYLNVCLKKTTTTTKCDEWRVNVAANTHTHAHICMHVCMCLYVYFSQFVSCVSTAAAIPQPIPNPFHFVSFHPPPVVCCVFVVATNGHRRTRWQWRG